MFKKEVLLGNFIRKNKILSYLEYIHNQFNIRYSNIFVYEIEKNDDEYMVTFKIDSEKRHYVNEIKGGTIFHFKKGCLFTINALNKLIENENKEKDYQIEWSKFTNTIILLHNNSVSVKDINKIDDKNLFFK